MKIRVLQPDIDAMSALGLKFRGNRGRDHGRASGRLITTPLDGAKLRKKRAVAAAVVSVTGIKPPFKRRPRNRRLLDLSNMQSPNPNSRFPSYFGPSDESSFWGGVMFTRRTKVNPMPRLVQFWNSTLQPYETAL